MSAGELGIAMDPSELCEGDHDELENAAACIKSWLGTLPEAE